MPDVPKSRGRYNDDGARMSADWTIYPLVGFGRLRFGLQANETSSLALLYGSVEGEGTFENFSAIEEETRRLFGGFFSQDTLEAGRAEARRLEATGGRRQSLAQNGIDLEFSDSGLVEITLSSATRQAEFEGHSIFALSSSEVLMLLESANDGPGRYGSTGAAFDAISVYLDSFTTMTSGVAVPMSEDDDRFEERTVTLRATPWRADEMLPDGQTFSFIQR